MAKIGINGRSWLARSQKDVLRDPVCDELRDFFNKQAGIHRNSELAVIAGLNPATINNLFGGKTRRPQHQTIEKAYHAMGCERRVVQIEKPDYASEIVQARAEFKEYKKALATARAAKKRRGK